MVKQRTYTIPELLLLRGIFDDTHFSAEEKARLNFYLNRPCCTPDLCINPLAESSLRPMKG